MLLYVFSLNILSCLAIVSSSSNECQFLTMCKCTNFPLFALIDTSYLSKPRSALNQDLFCAHASDASHENQSSTFEQLKYFYYRFRTLTFANYPSLPSNAFRFVHFESQSVKATHRTNNRNVIAFVNAERTQPGRRSSLDRIHSNAPFRYLRRAHSHQCSRSTDGLLSRLAIVDLHERSAVQVELLRTQIAEHQSTDTHRFLSSGCFHRSSADREPVVRRFPSFVGLGIVLHTSSSSPIHQGRERASLTRQTLSSRLQRSQ